MRKLITLAVTVLAVMAIGASTASAQVEVYDDNGNLCEPTCLVSVVGQAAGTVHTGYSASGQFQGAFACRDEFDAQIAGDGSGDWSNHLFHQASNCGVKPCGATGPLTGDGTPWPFQLNDVGGQLEAQIEYCWGLSYDIQCTITTDVDEIETGLLALSANNERCAEHTNPNSPYRTITGNWTIGNGNLGEIIH